MLGPRSKAAARLIGLLAQALGQTGLPIIGERYHRWLAGRRRWSADVPWSSLARTERSFYPLARRLLPEGLDLSVGALIFVLETYFALVAKLWPLIELKGEKWFFTGSLHLRLAELEDGSAFGELGVDNFPGENLYDWILSAWNEDLAEATGELIRIIGGLPPADLPGGDRLRELHQAFLPAPVRQRLGEFYSPDWLAQDALRLAVGELPDYKIPDICDPTCGSGAFLATAADWLKKRLIKKGFPRKHLFQEICSRLVGYDVNPLAVLAARANLLLVLGELPLKNDTPLSLPVKQVDALEQTPLRRFDIVIGNPPWLNWEGLSPEYRKSSRRLFEHYGLFVHRGMKAILGQGKKDLSMLAFPLFADRLLKDGGRICMVLPQNLLQSAGTGAGFRSFSLPDRTPLGPVRVQEWSELSPFGTMRAAVTLACDKGRAVKYPVDWRRAIRPAGPKKSAAVMDAESLIFKRLAARPVEAADNASPWIVTTAEEWPVLERMLGRSDYQGHAGAFSGGANGVFWLDQLKNHQNGTVTVRNRAAGGKKKVRQKTVRIEQGLLFPLLHARNVDRWRAEPEGVVLLPQDPKTRRGISREIMESDFPLTLEYLRGFKTFLCHRPALKRYFKPTDPWWSVFDVGRYTFSNWKVVWPSIAGGIAAAVVGCQEKRPIVPQHTVTMVATGTQIEAHYLCAVINSKPVSRLLISFSLPGAKGFGGPHILERIGIPAFSKDNPDHLRLAGLSRKAHKATRDGLAESVKKTEEAVNRIVTTIIK